VSELLKPEEFFNRMIKGGETFEFPSVLSFSASILGIRGGLELTPIAKAEIDLAILDDKVSALIQKILDRHCK
jgi:hypothetical protein